MNLIPNNAFNEFIKNISPNKDELNKIISSHTNVRSILEESIMNEKIDKTLLIGSYKRNTNIKTLVGEDNKIDVDLAVIFTKDSLGEPGDILKELFDLLNSNYNYENKVRIQSRSVGIELSKTHIDIVPFLQIEENSDKPLYISSKTKLEWEKTNPICHIEYFENIKKIKKNFSTYVKVLKWFKKLEGSNNIKFPPGLAIEFLVDKNYVEDNNLFKGFIETVKNVINDFKFSLKVVDKCNDNNNLVSDLSKENCEKFIERLEYLLSQIYLGLEEFNIEIIREVLGPEFPKCQIYSKDDLIKLKEFTAGTRHYSNKYE